MTLIAHISDLHISKSHFDEKVFLKFVEEINNKEPDLIILTGDLTNDGYYTNFKLAEKYLEMFKAPLFTIPGNHDARNVGHETFEKLIGERTWKLTKEDELVIIGLDSTLPDVNYGHIGREQQLWLEAQLEQAQEENLLTIVALHHHVLPIPKTGRERNILSDAGDILQTILDHHVAMVLCGHKHVPNLWNMEGTLFLNAGSLASYKLRGDDINSYNTYEIKEDSVEIILNKIDGTKIYLGEYTLLK